MLKRRCRKSLMGAVLVRLGVPHHARREAISTDFMMANVSSFSARGPDNEASMNEPDGCASASLDRIVCDNQRRSAKNDRDHDDNDEPHEHVACHKSASFKSRGGLLIE